MRKHALFFVVQDFRVAGVYCIDVNFIEARYASDASFSTARCLPDTLEDTAKFLSGVQAQVNVLRFAVSLIPPVFLACWSSLSQALSALTAMVNLELPFA